MTSVSHRSFHRSFTRPHAFALAVLVLLATCLVPTTAQAAPGPAPAPVASRVLATEHTDAISVFLDGERLVLGTKADVDGTHAKRLDPMTTLFHVTDALLRTAPSDPRYSFLGVEAGAPIHVIPQTFTPGVLWAGWNTESIRPGDLSGPVRLTLEEVTGPGRVELYVLDAESNPARIFSSVDAAHRVLDVPANVHAHASWVFTQPGVYRVTISAAATSAAGAALTAVPVTYTFVVGGPVVTAQPTTAELTASDAGSGRVSVETDVTWSGSPSGWGVPEGYVEILGITAGHESVLAHAALIGGRAEDVVDVPGHVQELRARFVPAQPNLAARSTSSPVPNPAADGDGYAVVLGLSSSYSVGSTITASAHVTGVDVPAIRWWLAERDGDPRDLGGASTIELEATVRLDGADLWFEVVDPAGAVLLTSRTERLTVVAATTAPSPTPPPSPSSSQSATTSPTPTPTSSVAGPTTTPRGNGSGGVRPVCTATTVTEDVPAGSVQVVSDGHLDFGPVHEGGTLVAKVKDDRGAPEWVDPAGLLFHLGDTAKVAVPADPQYAFLGTGDVWMIPLTQKSGIPWLGWNTQHPTIAGQASGDATLTLDSVDGPGELAVYTLDTFGSGVGEKYFGTVDGFPRSTRIPIGSGGVHVHGIWAFTEPGVYRVSLTWSLDVGGGTRTAPATLAFFVGPGDPSTAAQGGTVTRQVWRTPDGQPCDPDLASTGIDPIGTQDALVVAGILTFGGLAIVVLGPRRRAVSRH